MIFDAKRNEPVLLFLAIFAFLNSENDKDQGNDSGRR